MTDLNKPVENRSTVQEVQAWLPDASGQGNPLQEKEKDIRRTVPDIL
jgi:hypothetical protein